MVPRLPFAALLLAVATTFTPATARAESAGSPSGAVTTAFLDLGSRSACAVQHDRQIRCWGAGSSGRLGGSGLDDRLAAGGTAATQFAPGTITAIATGDTHGCALTTAGAVRCWGQGGSGQLGGGTRDNRLDGTADPLTGTDDATTVPLGSPASAITAGGDFSCAIVTGGAVRCWGDGVAGELGTGGTDNRLDGLADGPTDDASTVPLGGAAVAVSAGTQHACALLNTGVVQCWGNGGNGRLGSGATDSRLDGVPGAAGDSASVVPLREPAVAIAAGAAHTCALLASGAVSCWGLGSSGQLGGGRTDDRLDGTLGGNGTGVESGSGLTASNTNPYRQTDEATLVPLKPVGTAANQILKTASIGAVAIAAGDSHTCAVLVNGDVRCWGLGSSGQLGQGAIARRLESNYTSVADAASRAGGGTDGKGAGLGAPAIAVAAGPDDTCAELSTGQVRCWGGGDDGRLGSSATDDRLDGVIDAGTGTDEASIVPIGALPLNAADLTADPAIGVAAAAAAQAAAAQAAAAAAQAAAAAAAQAKGTELSFKFSLKGKKATIAALMALEPAKTPKKGKKAVKPTCPKKGSARIVVGKKTYGKASLKVKKSGSACRASGTVKLSKAPKKGAAVTLTLTGTGVVARTLTPTK